MSSVKKYAWYLKWKLDRSIQESSYDPFSTDVVGDYYKWICDFISKGYIDRIGLMNGSSNEEKVAALGVIAIGINVNFREGFVLSYDEFLSNNRDSILTKLGI